MSNERIIQTSEIYKRPKILTHNPVTTSNNNFRSRLKQIKKPKLQPKMSEPIPISKFMT